mmetsp:Transcript_36599/g.92442  ORF Transcript_36599/g.92442 Transcript_36599/m.92442 type:complete len:258 (-) Transcript_36599:2262-3035(-)
MLGPLARCSARSRLRLCPTLRARRRLVCSLWTLLRVLVQPRWRWRWRQASTRSRRRASCCRCRCRCRCLRAAAARCSPHDARAPARHGTRARGREALQCSKQVLLCTVVLPAVLGTSIQCSISSKCAWCMAPLVAHGHPFPQAGPRCQVIMAVMALSSSVGWLVVLVRPLSSHALVWWNPQGCCALPLPAKQNREAPGWLGWVWVVNVFCVRSWDLGALLQAPCVPLRLAGLRLCLAVCVVLSCSCLKIDFPGSARA